jgi:hypothetical protein
MSARDAYDFSRLTPAQEWLICLCGWHVGAKWPDGSMRVQPGKRTVRKLIERGLVVPRESRTRHGRVTEYDVPIAVHMAYCCRGGV